MSADTTAELLLVHLREEIETLDPDASLQDMELDSELASLGLDSMTMVSAVAALERRYAIRIPDERLAGLKTVNQLILLVQSAATTKERKEAQNDACCP